MKMLHNQEQDPKCTKFGYFLSLFASMVHKLAEWLGSPKKFAKISAVGMENTSVQFMKLPDVIKILKAEKSLQGQNYKVLAIALLVSSYYRELSAVCYDENLMADTFHLISVFEKSFNFSSQNPEVVGMIVYKLLQFLKHYPLANAKIGPATPRKRKRRNAQQGNQVQGKNRKRKKKQRPILYGQAVGPLGALFQYSCTPNIRRQLNVKTGKIEYCTIKEIPEGGKLYVGFTTFKIRNKNPHNWIKNHFLKKCLDCTNRAINLPNQ